MNFYLVVLVYACSFLLAVVLLYLFHTAWYWHVLSIAAALVIGLWPPPAPLAGRPVFDLLVGFLFIFLFVWGIGEPFFHRVHSARTRQPRAA